MPKASVEVSPDGRSSTYPYGASGTGPTASVLVDRALERMSDQLDPYDAARNLIARWVESDNSLAPLFTYAMDDLAARERAQAKPEASKAKRATKGLVPRVGDFAFIASSMGPMFYVIRKIHVGADGKLTALTLAPSQTSNAGQPMAIEKITAVFANTLTQE